MRTRLLRAAGHRRMPWRNGGGETREIAAFPDGAALADFAWRVSVASVAADGPFSLFPGVDRTLAILTGEGLRLAIEGLPPPELTPAAAPFAFPADRPTAARLLGGPVTDLNVMTRRGRWRHRMRRLVVEGEAGIGLRAATTLLFCPDGHARLAIGDGRFAIAAMDALLAEEPAEPMTVDVTCADRATLYVVELDPV